VSIGGGRTRLAFFSMPDPFTIVEGWASQVDIPGSCKITDYPWYCLQAIHLDLAINTLDVTGYYYDMMDRLAAVKIDAAIVEFEDKLR